tara:strand:- start:281 stop:1291 length:1011 start_codon:yes stop_codon:yes gene_type:complete
MDSMSIGLFGDSFAHCQHFVHSDIISTPQSMNEFDSTVIPAMPTWAGMLPDTINYANGGTDLSWSFLNFLENHEKHDTIVFVITDPNRITLRAKHLDISKRQGLPEGGLRISGVNANQSADKANYFKNAVRLEDIHAGHAYDALRNWQTYIQLDTPERDWLHYGVLINELQRIRPDIKLIKAFNHPTLQCLPISIKENILNLEVNRFAKLGYFPFKHFDNIPLDTECNYLHNICRAEFFSSESFKSRWDNQDKWFDVRAGHITSQSHLILFKIITAWLQTNDRWLNFDIEEFTNNNTDIDDCFIRRGSNLNDWNEAFLKRRAAKENINTKYDGKNK